MYMDELRVVGMVWFLLVPFHHWVGQGREPVKRGPWQANARMNGMGWVGRMQCIYSNAMSRGSIT